MPLEERRTRHDEMCQVLLANDVKYWGERFMTTLTRPHAVPIGIVRSGAFLND
jgi:trehalose-6-phosphate synthase